MNDTVQEALIFIQLDNCGACEAFSKKFWNGSYMLKYLNSKNIKPLRYVLSQSDKKIMFANNLKLDKEKSK